MEQIVIARNGKEMDAVQFLSKTFVKCFVVLIIIIKFIYSCIILRTQGYRCCAHFEEKGDQGIYSCASPSIGVSPAPFRVFNVLLSVVPNSCLMSELQISHRRCVDGEGTTASPERRKTSTAVSGSVAAAKHHQPRNVITAGAIVGICMALVFVICVGAWCLYAYRNPTSKAGLCLIDVSVLRFAKLNSQLAMTFGQLLLQDVFTAEQIFAVMSFLVTPFEESGRQSHRLLELERGKNLCHTVVVIFCERKFPSPHGNLCSGALGPVVGSVVGANHWLKIETYTFL